MFKVAVNKLKKSDPVLAGIMRRVGPCRLRQEQGTDSYFEALAAAIIYQQLNGKAAATIFYRFKSIYGRGRFPKPQEILRTPAAKLRKAGLSRQKLSYLKDLASKAAAGSVDWDSFHAMPDERIINTLTQIRGIGRWTAEMFLMFRLERPDVLPMGDYGFRMAVQKAYHFGRLPKPATLEKLAESWRPYRSVATWYLWQSLNQKK